MGHPADLLGKTTLYRLTKGVPIRTRGGRKPHGNPMRTIRSANRSLTIRYASRPQHATTQNAVIPICVLRSLRSSVPLHARQIGISVWSCFDPIWYVVKSSSVRHRGQTGGNAKSLSGLLWLRIACQSLMRDPPFVEWLYPFYAFSPVHIKRANPIPFKPIQLRSYA
jgi:hypothetical protein